MTSAPYCTSVTCDNCKLSDFAYVFIVANRPRTYEYSVVRMVVSDAEGFSIRLAMLPSRLYSYFVIEPEGSAE